MTWDYFVIVYVLVMVFVPERKLKTNAEWSSAAFFWGKLYGIAMANSPILTSKRSEFIGIMSISCVVSGAPSTSTST